MTADGAGDELDWAVEEVATPGGPARLHITPAGGPSRLRLLIGHGAGGGVESPDLLALSRALPRAGITVLRLEQPWRVAGRRLAGRPATLDEATASVLSQLSAGSPVVLAGRSAGARSACRVAGPAAAPRGGHVVGVICLAFPLHPPGKGRDPGRSRAEELERVLEAGLPLHVVQGSRDAFGSADDVRAAVPAIARDVHEVPLADHSFVVPKRAGAAAGTSTEQALREVVDAVSSAVSAIDGGGFSE